METAKQEEKEMKVDTEPERKKGFWSAFYNFLAMGGFLVVLVAIVAIVIAISVLTK